MARITDNNSYIKKIIARAKVARLATADLDSKPHLIPVVFVYDDGHYYIPIDEKTKLSSQPENLKRVKNITMNPNVALLIDEYNDDWAKLSFILILGQASLLGSIGRNRKKQNEPVLLAKAHKLLSKKYHQYEKIGLGKHVIMIYPQKIITWKNQRIVI